MYVLLCICSGMIIIKGMHITGMHGNLPNESTPTPTTPADAADTADAAA